MAWKVGFNKKVNVTRVITKIVVTVLAIYVGGALLDSIGDLILNTANPMYNGLTLLGYTVGGFPANSSRTGYYNTCAGTGTTFTATQTGANCVTSINASGGILTVVGLVGIASVIMEFVSLKMG